MEELKEKFIDKPQVVILMFNLILGDLDYKLKRTKVNIQNINKLKELKGKVEEILSLEEEVDEEIKIKLKEIKTNIKEILNSDRVKDFFKNQEQNLREIKNQNPKYLLKEYEIGKKISNLELKIILENLEKDEFLNFFDKNLKKLRNKINYFLNKNDEEQGYKEIIEILELIKRKYKEFGFDKEMESKYIKKVKYFIEKLNNISNN